MNPRAALLALVLVLAVSAVSALNATKPTISDAALKERIIALQQRLALKAAPVQPKANAMCQLCIEQGVAYINVLLNEILNNGIIYDCGALCSTYLKNKYEQDMCDAMCDGMGIYEFIELLMNTDIDAVLIYGCELIDACPISDCNGQCMSVVKFLAKPNPAPSGQDVHLLLTLNITQAWTGTGVFRFSVSGPNGYSDGSDQLIAGGVGPVGVGTMDITYSTKGSKKTGPLAPGTYQATVTICNGDCDPSGKIPHNQLLAQATVAFKLTK